MGDRGALIQGAGNDELWATNIGTGVVTTSENTTYLENGEHNLIRSDHGDLREEYVRRNRGDFLRTTTTPPKPDGRSSQAIYGIHIYEIRRAWDTKEY